MSFDLAFRKTIGERVVEIALESALPLIAISGASGSGKTTALNCIAGLMTADAGHIAIGGRSLFDSDASLNLPPEQRGSGYVFQDDRLFPHLNVRANLLYGSRRKGVQGQLIGFGDMVDLLDIEHLTNRFPQALSGGEKRRVAIGRALLSSPDFLLLDEPTSSLDTERAEQVLSAVERLRDRLGIPIIYVGHDHSEIARLTDSIITLD